MFGFRIFFEDIVSVKVGKYNWLKYGGKGIRFGIDGSTAYNMFGDKSEGVEITYKKGRGTKTILVSSADPHGLAGAIAEGRSKAGVQADSALGTAKADLGLSAAPEVDMAAPHVDDAVDEEGEALLRGEVPEELEDSVPDSTQK